MTNDLGDRITQEKHAAGEEQFRLITGFNDIFVVIACLLFLASIVYICESIAADAIAVSECLFAASAWGLAEFFTRKRLMALPSIVLLLAFVGGVFAAGIDFSSWLLLGYNTAITRSEAAIILSEGTSLLRIIILSSCVAAIAAMCHWFRFKVPITVAVGIMAVVFLTMASLITLVPETRNWMTPMTIVAGITVFVVAMYWDASDRLRQTRRSDVAFWIHLIAALLIVHPIFGELEILFGGVTLWQAITVIVLYIVIAIVSISIDRKAMMVSALGYLLYVLYTVLEQYDMISFYLGLTAFIIGSVLLLLSAFWQPCRKYLLHFYPRWVLDKLPNLR